MSRFLSQPTEEGGVAIIPLPLDVVAWPALAVTAAPVITSADGLVGTEITATDPTTNGSPVMAHQWEAGGIPIVGETGASFTPGPEHAGLGIRRRTRFRGWAFDALSNEIFVELPEEDEIEWGGTVDVSQISMEEGTDGRRVYTFASGFTIPGGRPLYLTDPLVDGGILDPATAVAVAGPFPQTINRNNSRATGTEIFFNLFVHDATTGQVRRVLPTSGTLATGQALSAVAGDDRGQVVYTISGASEEPEPGEWPLIGATHRSTATSAALSTFTSGANGSNFPTRGNHAVVLAMSSMVGETSTDTRLLQQLDSFLSPGNTPVCTGGVPMQREGVFVAFAIALRATPRLWDALPAGKRTAVGLIMEGTLYDAAWMGADAHPRSGSKELTQRGVRRTDRSAGGNINFAILSRLQGTAAWFGVSTAKAMLQGLDRADFRSRVAASSLGTGSNLYKTLNWRNEGNTTASGANGLSSAAPTDAQVQNAVKNWTFDGVPFDDFEGQLMSPNYGWRRVMPRWNPSATGSIKWAGQVQYGLENNAGLVGGTRGIILNPGANGAGTPHLGDHDCMVSELNWQDEGGPRSSMGYGAWGLRQPLIWMIGQEITGAWDRSTPGMQQIITEFSKAMDVFIYFDSKGYNSYAHGGSSGGGGGSPEVWPAGGPSNWLNAMNIALWTEVLKPRLGLT